MQHLMRSIISGLRNALAIGVVTSVNDTGGAKTANVSTGTNANRADVEIMDAWGFSSIPPADGVIGLVVAVGGDPSNLRMLPLSNPSARFGELLTGESVLYGADGSRVHIRQGGIVDIWGGTEVNVHTKACTVNAPNGCTLNGNFTLNGNLAVTGTLTTGNVSVEGNLTATGTVSDNHATL
jgi:phage baseplate assembly protein V